MPLPLPVHALTHPRPHPYSAPALARTSAPALARTSAPARTPAPAPAPAPDAEASATQARAGAEKVQLTSQLAGARKQAVRLQAEAEAAHEAQRSVVGAKQSELMQAQLKLSETEQLAELYRQAFTY